MTVQWNGAAVIATVRAATVTGIVRGVETIREEATSLITSGAKTGRIYRRGGVSHQASAPGESPASDTGLLVNSITTSVDQGDLSGSVNFGTAFSRFLEYGTSKMAPRPYARVAIAHKRDAIIADIGDEIRKSLA